jgi:FlaA1/EpsC-like NDP-sugar epimerase
MNNLPRNYKQFLMLIFDSVATILMLFLAFSVRLGEWHFPNGELLYLIILSPVISLITFMRFDLYRAIIRFISFTGIWKITQAVSLYGLIWGVFALIFVQDGIPRSVVFINWLLLLIIIVASRLFAHWLFNEFGKNKGKEVIIYGAGSAGRQLLLALKHSSEYNPIAFIDDDNSLAKSIIGGVEVLNKNKLDSFIHKHSVQEVLLAVPSASNSARKQIIGFLQNFPVSVRTLPGVSAIAAGKVNISDLRAININDLLGREKVSPNLDFLKKNITQKVVCVTGAGGSIGTELCRQILALRPKKLILYELSEFALYQIHQELTVENIEVLPILGSATDKNRLKQVFTHFSVESVYHAAAYKHVPMVEFNTTQGVNNNVIGTLHCALAACEAKVANFMLISTDKAVRPTNTMGASKRFAELILQALAQIQEDTNFSMVRFGNVLGSSGSVIPLFTQQIKKGGPVTVTDKEITRYFMTIPEAVELVIQASSMSLGGDVFVLDMGKPIKIDDLAKKMIRLSGYEVKDASNPEGDIEIQYTGLRAGEKLYEELLIGGKTYPTDNSMIMRAKEERLAWSELEQALSELVECIEQDNPEKLRLLLMQVMPDFKPQCQVVDLLTTRQ